MYLSVTCFFIQYHVDICLWFTHFTDIYIPQYLWIYSPNHEDLDYFQLFMTLNNAAI